jgi:putative FmdB family regulatory protein
MPTYQYRCAKCGEQFELWQSIHDDALQKHPGCGGKVTKVLSPAGIVLKGPGFYRTDNRSSASGRSRDKSEKAEKAEKAEKSETKGDSSSSNGSKDSKGSSGGTKSSDTSSSSKKDASAK